MVEAELSPIMKVVFSRAEKTELQLSSQPQVWSVAEVSSIGFAFDWSIHLSVRLVSLQGLIHVSGLYEESLLHSRERKKKKAQSLPKQKLTQNVPLMFCWWRPCFAQLAPQSLTKLSGNLSTSIYLALCSDCWAVWSRVKDLSPCFWNSNSRMLPLLPNIPSSPLSSILLTILLSLLVDN